MVLLEKFHQCAFCKIEERTFLVVSVPSASIWNVRNAKDIPLLVQIEERMREMCFYNGDPFPPSVYLGGH